MNTRTLYKRLRRASKNPFETAFGSRFGIDILLPTSLLAEQQPPKPELPPDLMQGVFIGDFVPAKEEEEEKPHTRIVSVYAADGDGPEKREALVPGSVREIEPIEGRRRFTWYEATDWRDDGSKLGTHTPYFEPWVLQEIAYQEWQQKAQDDVAHPVLARLKEIHRHASKRTVYVLNDGLHVTYLFKTYDRDREHLMDIARTASRAIRFAERQGVPIRVRV